MAQLSPEQTKVLHALLTRAQKAGASPRELKALVEAGLVESNLRNLNYGDRDSLGVLQQRPSQGWANATNPSLAAADFLRQAQQINRGGFHGSAGQLAQAVQRSAFPARYDQRGGQAAALIGGMRAGGVPSPGTGDSTTTTTSRTIPGVDNSQQRLALTAAYLANTHDPNALTALAAGLLGAKDTPARTTTSSKTTRSKTGSPTGSSKGLGPLRELFYQGPGGIDVKNGAKVPQGFVTGHQDHVHVASGPKTVVELGRLAESMGLHVGENPHFGGVNPVHTKTSYHYKGEAIDVSGSPEKMRAFARKVASIYHVK